MDGGAVMPVVNLVKLLARHGNAYDVRLLGLRFAEPHPARVRYCFVVMGRN